MSGLRGKRILLGVSGGISAYKAVEVLRLLTKAEAVVDVVMTEEATRFITAATMRGLSGRPVIVDLHDLPGDMAIDRATMPHLDVAEGADLAIIAPATANTLAKMTWGLADNALVTTLLSVTAPVIVAPAMDSDMWRHPATQENVRRLRDRGVVVVGPEHGALARMNVGPGRLADPEKIVAKAREMLEGSKTSKHESFPLAGRRVVVTAGGTREPIDPVRFITNRSSGKMGYALAAEALEKGADVTLISAPTALQPPVGCDVVGVETALEMKEAVEKKLREADIIIMAAAVADFRPDQAALQKVKKGHNQTWEISLVRNPDIAAAVGASKRPGQVLVIFAAETENVLENARKKLKSKQADMVVANDVSQEGAGFDVDTNVATLLFSDGSAKELPLMSKRQLAEHIIDYASRLVRS